MKILYLIIYISVMLLILWLVFLQLQKDNKIGAYLIYFVISLLSLILSRKFNLTNIVSIMISSLITYGFSLFCYKRCKDTFGSFILTQIIWGLIFGLILFAIYYAIIMITIGSLNNSILTFNAYN